MVVLGALNLASDCIKEHCFLNSSSVVPIKSSVNCIRLQSVRLYLRLLSECVQSKQLYVHGIKQFILL